MAEFMDSEFLEKLIIKSMLQDKNFSIMLSRVFRKDYFDNFTLSIIYDKIVKHLDEYNNIPEESIIINSVDEDNRGIVRNTIGDINSIDYNLSVNYQHLLNQTNFYLKEQALKKAVMDTVSIIDKRDEYHKIREKIEEALSKDLTMDLGLNYFDQISERLKRIFTTVENRVPTFFPKFDEYISGGFPPLTLSIILAKIHGMKSNTIINFAARQALHGKNSVIITLEMSEDMVAQRFDSIYSLLDINKIYTIDSHKRELVARLKDVKKYEGRGDIYIKEFPTGNADVNDIRAYLRELTLRNVKIDVIYVDYINILKNIANDTYMSVKKLSEDLRALSYMYKAPVISVSQINRPGMFTSFKDIDFSSIAESIGVAATADFIMIYGIDEDSITYECEVFYKIVKNRLGGRIGAIDKFYYDDRSLKMYDESEMNVWIEDGNKLNNDRRLYIAEDS